MSESLFEKYKEDVRSRLSLRTLVEECAPKGLRSTGGSSLICCSPLRPDKHPSFSVFEGGGEYMAFDHATRESFDLFAFVQRREGLTFAESVKWCGDRSGLPWDEYRRANGGDGRAPAPPGITDEEWERAYEKMLSLDEAHLVSSAQQAMVDLCHAMFLRSSLPKYVEERWGILPETQSRFMLGFVPHGFAGLLEELRDQGAFDYDKKQLVKTGWFLQVPRVPGDPDPPLRCIFDGRLLYPYLWRGRCRYACARIVHEHGIEPAYFERREWEQAKFKKALVGGASHPSVSRTVQNDVLYNADNAARSRTGFKRIVIVEGPSDCMAMVQAGYDCVAPVTTSVRTEDVPMLLEAVKGYAEVLLATDTDVTEDGRRPGLEGALRMATELLRAGKRVRLLVFPLAKGQTKMDPAQWALDWRSAGKEGDPFSTLVAEAPGVAAALVGTLDPDLSAAQLPEALTPIVKFARAAKSARAEIEEIARLARDRLKRNFTRNAILQAMGEVGDKLEAEERAPAVDDRATLALEGTVIECGGHDEPGKTRHYRALSKQGPAVVSTFILQPERVIISSSGERLVDVSVHIETDTTLLSRWIVPKRAWSSRRNFVESFPHERMQWTGSDDNLQAVYKLVSERAARKGVPVVRGEPVIGLHHTTGGMRLVLPGETWTPDGPMAAPDIVYSPDAGFPPLAHLVRVDGEQRPSDVDDLCVRILTRIYELNDPVALETICSWIVGCYFLPQIRECNGGKASILNVFGSPGSGKTTLVHKILNVTLQPFSGALEPSTPAETRFALVRSLSWSNMLLTPFDEYRVSESNDSFLRILRTGFSGGVENRGRMDLSVKSFSLVGAAQVCGEQRADADPAMGERLVMVGLDRTTIERKDATDALREVLSTDEKWRVATDILQWRMRVDPRRILDWWSESRADALRVIGLMKLQVAPRSVDVCAEMAFRKRVWREWLSHRTERRIELPDVTLESVLRKMLETTIERELPETTSGIMRAAAKSLVIRALEEITPYAVSGTFEEKRGWRMCLRGGRKMLVVYPGLLVSVLSREAKLRGKPDPTNGLPALKRSAREEAEREGDLGWLVDPGFPYRMGSADDVGGAEKGSDVRARCWLIDVQRAREMAGLELDWPGDVSTWGGERARVPAGGNVGLWKKGMGDVA